MPTSTITTYSQLYKTCESFPNDQWISVFMALTSVVAGSPAASKLQLNVLAQPKPIHLFAYVTASDQVITIHLLLQLPTRLGQPTMQ